MSIPMSNIDKNHSMSNRISNQKKSNNDHKYENENKSNNNKNKHTNSQVE